MPLRPGLHRIVAPLGERFIAMHVLEGPAGALLMDTGIAESVTGTLLPALAEQGIAPERLRWVISSHCDFDHTGGNAAIRRAVPGVELLAGAEDVPLAQDLEALIEQRYGEFREPDGFDDPPETTRFIRESSELVPIDRALHGGEEFDLGDRRIRVLHAPGHSPGHLALHDPDNRALVIGDATLGDSVLTADGAPAFPPTYRDVEPYLASIQAFRALEPELLLTAHYPVYAGDEVAAFLDRSRDYVARIDEVVAEELMTRAEPVTTLELIAATRDRLGAWPPAAADYLIFPMTGNLERLAARGLVTEERGGERRTWRWAA